MLLVLRANEPGQGRWSLPGGRVEQGESDESALRREVTEETGLSVTIGPEVGRLIRPSTRAIYQIIDYTCWVTDEELFPGDDAADAMWTDSATFTTLDENDSLTEQLAELLAQWDCLPRDQ